MKTFTGKIVLIFLLSLFFVVHVSAQKDFVGTAGASWNVGTNWNPTGVPTISDVVTIQSGKTLTVPDDAFCSSLTILGGTSANTISISSGKTLTVAGAISLGIPTGNVTKTITVGAGNLICSSISMGASTANQRVNSITATTGKITVSGDVSLLGTGVRSVLNITSSGKLTIGGNVTGAGRLTLANTSTVELNGTSAQQVPFTSTGFADSYGNLIINNSSGVSVNSVATVNGALTLTDGELSIAPGVSPFTISGNASRTNGTLSSAATGTVSYNRASAGQTIVAGTYGNLTLNNVNKVFPSDVINIAGTFTPGTATGHTMTGNTINFSSSGAQTVPATFKYFNLGITGTGTKSISAASLIALNLPQNFEISAPVSYNNISTLSIGGNFTGTNSINSGTIPLTIGGSWNNTATGYSLTGAVAYTGATATLIRIGGINYKDLNFTASRGASFPVTADIPSPLTISGTLTVGDNATFATNDNVTFISTQSGISNVAPLSGTAAITGNAKVQLFFTGGAGMRGTRMLSPVIDDSALPDGSKFLQQLKGNMVITGAGGVANGFDAGNAQQPYATTLTLYNESAGPTSPQFNSITNIGVGFGSIPPGNGIFLFYRGDRSGYNPPSDFSKLSSGYIPESFSALFSGPLVTGNYAVPIQNSNIVDDPNNGYNVIGNPYLATIDWEKVYASNSALIANEFRIIRPGGGVMSRKVIGGNPVVVNAGDELAAQFLQPGQAFYIRKLDPGVSNLNFSESHKAVAGAPNRLLANPGGRLQTSALMEATAEPAIVFYFNLKDQMNSDESAIIFMEGFDPNFDGNDVPYFSGSTVSLSSQTLDGKNVAINFTKEIGTSQEIKVNVNAAASGPVSLNFTSTEALGSYNAILKDKYLNTSTDIKANPVYQFNIDKAVPETFGSERFVLVFSNAQPRAVSLTKFELEKRGFDVRMEWTTPNETDSKKFEIERSTDATTFAKIGELSGAGTVSQATNYSYVDKHPVNGMNFYRLKQLYSDSTFAYSETKSIEIKLPFGQLPKFHFQVFPNPATNYITVEVPNIRAKLVIYDLFGRVRKTATYERSMQIRMDVSDLKNGVYFAEVTDLDNSKATDIVIFIKK